MSDHSIWDQEPEPAPTPPPPRQMPQAMAEAMQRQREQKATLEQKRRSYQEEERAALKDRGRTFARDRDERRTYQKEEDQRIVKEMVSKLIEKYKVDGLSGNVILRLTMKALAGLEVNLDKAEPSMIKYALDRFLPAAEELATPIKDLDVMLRHGEQFLELCGVLDEAKRTELIEHYKTTRDLNSQKIIEQIEEDRGVEDGTES